MVAERDQPLRGWAAAPFDIAKDRKAEIASPRHDIQRPNPVTIDDQDGRTAEDLVRKVRRGAQHRFVVIRDEPFPIRTDGDPRAHRARVRVARRERGFNAARNEIAQHVFVGGAAQPSDEPGASAEPRDGGKRRRDISPESSGTLQNLPLTGRQGLIDIDDVVDRNSSEAED